MKLLLDEMYPPALAEQLRRRGHDVDAVTKRAELRHLPDFQVFEAAQRERRAVVTENLRDYIPIAGDYASRGQAHFGLVLVDASKYPRGAPGTVGRMVTELDHLLKAKPADEPTSFSHWL